MKVLEYKDVQQFTVVEVGQGQVHSLRLSGLAFHSALAVEGVEKVADGKRLKVRVFLSPARPGMSGRFEFVVEVPKGVREVLFGDEGHLIWSEPSP